jgi:hypothetical protein
MTGLLLSEETNDLQIINGDLQMSVDSTTALRQRILITLSAWLGEWKLNTAFGIPYRQSIFVKGVTKEGVDAIFLGKIVEFEEVEVVEDFESTFNSATREYDVTRLVVRTTTVFTSQVTQFDPDDVDYQPSPISPVGNICVVV